MWLKKYGSRGAYISSILLAFTLLSLVVITYHTMLRGELGFHAQTWGIIDMSYVGVKGILILWIISSVVSLIFREIKYAFILGHPSIHKILPLVQFFCLTIIWVIGLSTIMETIGIPTSKVLTSAGIGGLLLAYGGRDLIANIFGSAMMILGKKFDIGDTIKIRTYEGVVEEMTLDHTRIMNNDGKVVFIPNKVIISEPVENISRRRFATYKYLLPIKKDRNADDVYEIIRMVEGKITEYTPLRTSRTIENPNATDILYTYSVDFPETNKKADEEIQQFLVKAIFTKN